MKSIGRRLVPVVWALVVVPGARGVASPSADIRVVRVKAVADEAFRTESGWEKQVREDLASASETLRELAGISLDLVAVEPWTTHQGASMPLLLEELRTGVEKDDAEVVIGFTGHRPPAAVTFLPGNPKRYPVPFTAGIALPLGDRAVVRRTNWDELTRRTLVHEVAHLFGGLHVREESILETATDRLSFRLDPFNRRVLDLTRDRDFGRGIREIPEDDLAALVELYHQAPLRGDSDPDTIIRIAYVFTLAGEVEDALQLVREALEIAPEQSRSVLRHALIPELEAWAETREATVRSRYLLARAYALAERWRAASALLERGCGTPPGDAPSCALLGTVQLELGQGDEAERNLLAALRRNDSLAEAHQALGRVYAAARRHEEAIEAFGRALELAPEDVGLHLEMGLAYLAAGKAGAAEASFREVLRVRETDDEARAKLALALARQGRGDEARALLEPFETRASLSAFVLRDMAEVYLLSGDARKAFETVQLAKKGGIDVQAVETLIQQGAEPPPEVELGDLMEQAEAYYRTGRYGTARQLLGRALARRSQEPRVHYWLGRVAAAEDDRKKAREHLRRAIELEPNFLPPRYELARLAYGDEDYAEVVAWLEPYVKSGQAGSTAHFMLGRSQFERGRLREAEEHLRASIRKRADYGSSFYYLARVYLEEGRDEEARRELELAVDSRSLSGWRREDAHLRLARLLDAAGEEARAENQVAEALGLGATPAGDAAIDATPATDRIELLEVEPSLAKPLPRGREVLVVCTIRFELGTAARGAVFLAPQDESGHTLLRPQPRARVERGRGEVTLRALITTPTTGSAVDVFLALHAQGHRSTAAVTRARYALE
jgi:tetratricopeptide (TPR) repeat protein